MKAVNLLPSEQKGAPKAAKSPGVVVKTTPESGPFGAYCILGGMALAVLGAAAFVLTNNQISDKQAELAKASSDRQVVEAKATALKPYGDFQTLATQRVSTVVSLASSRFDWDRALADVSRALPADVRIKSLNGSVSPGAGGGSALRSAVPSPAIELGGCTISQSGVARLMARLRSVRGVTRVALAKSDKDTVTTNTDKRGDAAASLCGRGTKPTFELVMFFERAVVAPGTPAVPGAPAPQPGATPAAGAPPAQGAQPGTAQPTQPGTASAPPATQGVSSK